MMLVNKACDCGVLHSASMSLVRYLPWFDYWRGTLNARASLLNRSRARHFFSLTMAYCSIRIEAFNNNYKFIILNICNSSLKFVNSDQHKYKIPVENVSHNYFFVSSIPYGLI